MHLDPPLNVLLVVTVSLQLGAVATRVAGRKLVALAMAGANAALAFAFALMILAEILRNHERIEFWPDVLLALAVTAAVASAIGLAKRSESGWLLWAVWLWNFVMIGYLVDIRFFFRLVF
jgi:hypothetical protein